MINTQANAQVNRRVPQRLTDNEIQAKLESYLRESYCQGHFDRIENAGAVFVVDAVLRQWFPILRNVSEIHYKLNSRICYYPARLVIEQ